MDQILLSIMIAKLEIETNFQVTEEEKQKVVSLVKDDDVSTESTSDYIYSLINKYTEHKGTSKEKLKQIAEDLSEENDTVVISVVNGNQCKIASEMGDVDHCCVIALGLVNAIAKTVSEEDKRQFKEQVMEILGE